MTDGTAWILARDGEGIAWLTLDCPGGSTNTLTRAVLAELDARLRELAASVPRGLVVRSGKASGFISGADIREFTTLRSADDAYALVRAGQQVFGQLEALPCPTVAAIHGYALGGGLELSLACRYRIAVGDERLALGLPEVQLGIHPGFGGTVRAVRLLGARRALDLMLTGRSVRADKALRLGLLDRLVAPDRLEECARDFVRRTPPPHRPPLTERALSWPLVRPLVKRQLLAQVRRRVRPEHYPAPYAIVDLWAAHGAVGAAAYEAEARSIARLFRTDTARNLVRVFLLRDRLKSQGAADPPLEIRRVHVVGAGVMGGDIAAWCVLRGFEVTLQDRELRYVEPALARARALFAKRFEEPRRGEADARLQADVEGTGAARADVVIEAIFENLEAKRALYAALEPRMKPQALLATNTSSIMLEPLAADLANPRRLVGLHFFNPVAQMPLVEIVRSADTDPRALQAAIAFTHRLDKLPLVCRSAPGFVVNRVLMPYLHEAMIAAEEGVPLAVIDEAALQFGMPMGPVELADVVGLDVAKHVGEIIAAELQRAPPDLTRLAAHVAAGKTGRKSGEGFYRWQDGKALKPAAPRSAVPPDLQDRLVLALLNECVAVLRERIVDSADELDAAVIFGAGFAPFRGGPLHYARSRGIDALLARLEELAQRHGARFRPDPGWAALAASHKA